MNRRRFLALLGLAPAAAAVAKEAVAQSAELPPMVVAKAPLVGSDERAALDRALADLQRAPRVFPVVARTHWTEPVRLFGESHPAPPSGLARHTARW